jgi:hypothetical protein
MALINGFLIHNFYHKLFKMEIIKYATLFLVSIGCTHEEIQKRSNKKWIIEANPSLKPLPENEQPIFEDDSATIHLHDSIYNLQKSNQSF